MITLIGFQSSPWTERARWALDARKIEYQFKTYTPLIDEPALRLRLGNFRTKVTVPTLFRPKYQGAPLMESYEIARWAQRHGGGDTLFPEHLHKDIAHINVESERLLSKLRAHFTLALLDDDDAKKEQLPEYIPKQFYGLANLGLWYITTKYDLKRLTPSQIAEQLSPTLSEWQSKIGDGAYVFDQWSYADILVASTVNFIAPHPSCTDGPASANCQRIDSLVEPFEALINWRDRLYDERR